MSERDPVPALDAYPHDRPVEERLRFALRFAVLAPSSHNAQPWLFRIEGDHVDVLIDRTRAQPVMDPHDRELPMFRKRGTRCSSLSSMATPGARW